MDLDREELKKLLKAKGVKSLDDFNAFMRDISKNVVCLSTHRGICQAMPRSRSP